MNIKLNNKVHFLDFKKEKISIYFLSILFFTIGISSGAFTAKALDLSQKQSLVSYINSFLNLLNNTSVKRVDILVQSLKNNISFLFFIYIFGITFIGIPFTLITVTLRGFISGFTIAFLTDSLGWNGIYFFISAILPQNILYIPAIIIASVISMKYSVNTFKDRYKLISRFTLNKLLPYTTTMLALILVFFIGAVIEAYISPLLLKSLSKYIIGN